MMHTRRISRFRPRRSLEQGPGFWQKAASHGGAVLVVLASAVLGYGLWWAPRQMTLNLSNNLNDTYYDRHVDDLNKVERHWESAPILPAFVTGDEPAVRDFLAREPLMVAALDRLESRTIWVRQGDRFVKAEECPQVQLYRAWFTQNEVAQRYRWMPSSEHDPDHARAPSIVLLGDHYSFIKRWVPGSPQVEAALHVIFGTKAPLRVGIHRDEASLETRKKYPFEAWGAEPRYQVDTRRFLEAGVRSAGSSDALGEGWNFMGVPWKPELRGFEAQLFQQRWYARIFAVLVAMTLATGLWLRRRARKQAQLEADRMAALTHSLKTPLAVLKFRCDSIRLGRLSEEQADAELIRIGEEVDNLTQMISHGLSAMSGGEAQGPQREVNVPWLLDVAEDLRPAFEADQRTLDLQLSPDSGQAALPSLRPALLTLLENALFHGGGRVAMETWRRGRRFYIRVSDEGPGVDAAQLAAMGKPFMRFRKEGKEGFTREGQGLGISLLCQVAQREGWGLDFTSAPGRGFQATLVVEAQ